MRAGLAERQTAERPRDERATARQLVAVEAPSSRHRPGLGPRGRPGAWLVLFAICLAALAVGRVTLSFAVVQKNLDTAALTGQQREVRAENVRLQEKIAELSATPRLQQLATQRYGLVPASDVIYLEAERGRSPAGGD